jgi:hypothetical protein
MLSDHCQVIWLLCTVATIFQKSKILEALIEKYELHPSYPPGDHVQHFDTDAAHKEEIRATLASLVSEDGPVDDARNDPLDESMRTLVNYTYGPLHSQLLVFKINPISNPYVIHTTKNLVISSSIGTTELDHK